MKRAVGLVGRLGRQGVVSGGSRQRVVATAANPLVHYTCNLRMYSTWNPLSTQKEIDVSTLTGEECYQRALDALEKARVAKEEAEAKRSQEQFQAWQKAQESSNKRSARREGVAVIKTIAKQARKAKKLSAHEELEQQANEWMKRAALDHCHAIALVRLGNDSLRKANLSSDINEARQYAKTAMEYYEMAANEGSAEACFNLGHMLWDEQGSSEQDESAWIVEKNNKESIKWFQRAIDLGDRDAMFFVGVQLLSGEEDDNASSPFVGNYSSLTDQYQAGLDLIEQAASLEHGGALYYLCLLHLNGHDALNIPPCRPEEFVGRLDAAANAGDPDALFLRGHCYYHGDDGYNQNFESALENFLAAADAGHSDAAVSAGAMLHQGVGVAKDQRRAFELYQMAGELGNKEGWRNVVACYATGEGVPQSEEMARYVAKTILKDDVTS